MFKKCVIKHTINFKSNIEIKKICWLNNKELI